ncbi:MAG: hypothetical protein WBJ68_15150 [Candidatus Dechloromonas phosphoritropha]|jgi:hypothetical protein
MAANNQSKPMTHISTNELNQAFATTRTIPTKNASNELLTEFCERLVALKSVTDVCIVDGDRICVSYDSSRLGFWEIDRLLDEVGVARPTTRWWRIKSEWFCFTDRNARDNAHHVATCCSKPPVKPGA